MKRNLTLATIVCLLIGLGVLPISSAQQGTAETDSGKVRALLQQRHDVLQERYEYLKQISRYRDQKNPHQSVVPALDELLQVKIELAETAAERVAICKQRVENRRQLEEYEQLLAKIGADRTAELLTARSARIQAEIDCLRLQEAAGR